MAIDLTDLSEKDADVKGSMTFTVEKQGGEETDPEPEKPDPQDDTLPTVGVAAEGFVDGQWSSAVPVFTLSGKPEGDDWYYVVYLLDEGTIPLSGSSYSPDEGIHALSFKLQSRDGREAVAPGTYNVMLDTTAPESVTIAADTKSDYTINITASDSLSGVTGVSLDGGRTWKELSDGDTFTKTYDEATKLAAGTIHIRDAAGNVYISEKDYSLDKAQSASGGISIGGGTGSSDKKKENQEHAKGDGVDEGEYGTLALRVQDGPMSQLIMGGEVLPVTLTLESADAPGAPVGRVQFFTGSLTRWGGGETPDTLMLSAQMDDDLGEAFTFAWQFSGEVTRRLYDSGIKYLALRVGGDIIGLPTEGFTAGTQYDALKMEGVSNRRFNYTFTMRENLNPGYVSAMYENDRSTSCDMSVRVDVEDMAYELSNSSHSLMYYRNVYLGPKEMLQQPFGA